MMIDVKVFAGSLAIAIALAISGTLVVVRTTTPVAAPAQPGSSCNQAIRDVERGVLRLVPSKDTSRPM
ncbi:MAG: hypothetical protein WCE44_14680 [Candidatus Velthaea sp.]